MTQLVRASLSGMCRAVRPGFEPHSDHQFLISKFYFVLYQSVRSLILSSRRNKAKKNVPIFEKKKKKLSHYIEFISLEL